MFNVQIGAFNTNNTTSASNSARIAVDSALITILLNLLAFVVNSPAIINIMLDNKLDMTQLAIMEQKRKYRLELSIFFDYRYKWLKKILNKFGGVKVKVVNTGWTSIEVDKRQEYAQGVIDYSNPSKYILIDINKLIPDERLNGKLYFELNVSSNTTIKSDGDITTEVKGGKVFNILKNSLISIQCSKQSILFRELD